MINNLLFKCLLLSIISILILVCVNPADAQSIGFNMGWYHSINPATPSFDREFKSHQKPSLSFAFYFRNILDNRRNFRLGICASFVTVKKKPIDPSNQNWAYKEGYRYLLSSFLFSYQRKLVNRKFFYLMMNFSAGVSFISYENLSGYEYSEDFSFNLPETSLSFQPGFDFIFKVYKHLALQINVRYNFLTANKRNLYPFSSGYLLEMGFLLESPFGSSKNVNRSGKNP